MIPLSHVLVLSAALFAIGIGGLAVRRSAVCALMSLQLMLLAGSLAFVAFNRLHAGVPGAPDVAGHVFALAAAAVAAAQALVGVAIVIALLRGSDSIDLERASLLRW